MNVRKPINYNTMFAALDALMVSALLQVELYCAIGQLVSTRPEKGAAVAAAGYITKTYPDASGFSPRNLRRMREFYRAYENTPEVLAEAMTISWTQNIVIMENCVTAEERRWYIAAVRRFHWTKAELLEKISEGINRSETLPLSSIEDAEDAHPLYNIDVSNTTVPKGNTQVNFSRLASPAVIYWAKQQSQDWRKDGAGDTSIQDQRCDRPGPAGSVRECPGLADTGLLLPVDCLSARHRVRPCLPSLRPPADWENNTAPPGCAGYDARGCGKNGLCQGRKTGHDCGPEPGHGAAPFSGVPLYASRREVTLMRDFIDYRNAEEFLKGLPSIQLRIDRMPSNHSGPRRT